MFMFAMNYENLNFVRFNNKMEDDGRIGLAKVT